VTQESATIDKAWNRSMDKDHRHMQRFASQKDADYKRVIEVLECYQKKALSSFDEAPAPSVAPDDPYFSGSDEKLIDIHNMLDPKKAIGESRTRYCILHGIAGAGKTTLAAAYYHKFKGKDHYNYQFWVKAEEPTQRDTDFVQIEHHFDRNFKPDQYNQRRNIEVARARLQKNSTSFISLPNDLR
jgi:signal recognition particle GTPase